MPLSDLPFSLTGAAGLGGLAAGRGLYSGRRQDRSPDDLGELP